MISQDLQKVIDKDYFSLWKQYEPLVCKFYWKLWEDIRLEYFENSFEDFHNWTYQYFVMAVDSLDINKIKNKENWSFYIQIYHYLLTYTEHLTTKYYKNANNEYSYNAFENDFANDVILEDVQEKSTNSNIEDVLNMLDEKDRKNAIRNMHRQYSSEKWKISEKGKQIIKDNLVIF